MIANVIAVSTLNTGARYLAMMLFPTSLYGATVVILSWIAGSLTQPAVKRAAAMALINAVRFRFNFHANIADKYTSTVLQHSQHLDHLPIQVRLEVHPCLLLQPRRLGPRHRLRLLDPHVPLPQERRTRPRTRSHRQGSSYGSPDCDGLPLPHLIVSQESREGGCRRKVGKEEMVRLLRKEEGGSVLVSKD